jgi:isovaleryl-CoA dehydrogenase
MARRAFASKDHFYQIMQLTETRRDLLQMVESFADAEV